jgi:hypothetical protein
MQGIGFWLLDGEKNPPCFSAAGFSYVKLETVVGWKRNYKYDD